MTTLAAAFIILFALQALPSIAIRLWALVGIALGAFLLRGVRPLFA